MVLFVLLFIGFVIDGETFLVIRGFADFCSVFDTGFDERLGVVVGEIDDNGCFELVDRSSLNGIDNLVDDSIIS